MAYRTPKFSPFNIAVALASVMLFCVATYLVVVHVDFTYLFLFDGLGLPQLNLGPPLVVLLVLFILHIAFLLRVRNLNTHETRRKVLFAFALIFVAGAFIYILYDPVLHTSGLFVDPPPEPILSYDLFFRGAIALGAGLCLLLWFSGFITLSVPSQGLAIVPLALLYLIAASCLLAEGFPRFYGEEPRITVLFILAFAYLPLAGYLFPRHRRMVEYFRPPSLPRLPRRNGKAVGHEIALCKAPKKAKSQGGSSKWETADE